MLKDLLKTQFPLSLLASFHQSLLNRQLLFDEPNFIDTPCSLTKLEHLNLDELKLLEVR